MLDHCKTMKINAEIDSYKWRIIMTLNFIYGTKDNSFDIIEQTDIKFSLEW